MEDIDFPMEKRLRLYLFSRKEAVKIALTITDRLVEYRKLPLFRSAYFLSSFNKTFTYIQNSMDSKPEWEPLFS